jgi:hypothetical protein
MKEEPVEIWFRISKDADGYPSQEWEQLYAWPTTEGYQLDNVPFFARGIAVGDVVIASKTEEGWLGFDRVAKRSGHSTFRIWLSEGVGLSATRVLEDLRGLGCRAEITLERLIAIDVSLDRETQVWDFLAAGRERGDWEIQVGHSPAEEQPGAQVE